MAEIDMIPRSYHDAMRVQRALSAYAIAGALLLALVLLLGVGLRWRIASQEPLVAALRSRSEQSEHLRQQVEQAQLRQRGLTQQLAALNALRGAGEVERVTSAINASLNRSVWFSALHYARDAQAIPAGTVAPAQNGYLLVLPADPASQAAANRSWRLSNNLEINGSALEHAALTDFLHALAAQPAIADVHFVNSTSRANEGSQQVDFNVVAATRPPTARAP